MLEYLRNVVSQLGLWKAPLIGTAVVFCAFVFVVQNSETFQTCIDSYKYKAAQRAFPKQRSDIPITFIARENCWGTYIHDNAEGLVAFFTIILAGSTIGLWLSTNQLWKVTDKMLQQADQSDRILQRAYLWPGYGLLIFDQFGMQFGIHLGIRNTGSTAGIIKTVHHAVLTKEEFEANNPITYYIFNGREDAIIPDPNTEVRSGVWHRLSEMPKVSCGWITYIDVFGVTWRRGYKYLIDARGRTDSLPDCFTYEPWTAEHQEKPSEQEPVPGGYITSPIKSGETA